MFCILRIISVVRGGWTSRLVGTIEDLVAHAVDLALTEKLENACASIEGLRRGKKRRVFGRRVRSF